MGHGNVAGADGVTYNEEKDRVLINAAANTNAQHSSGHLVDNKDRLDKDLMEDQRNIQHAPGRVQTKNTKGETSWVTQDCYTGITTMQAANSVSNGVNFSRRGQFVTSWNSSVPINNPNYGLGREQLLDSSGPTNSYGFTNFTSLHIPRIPRGMPSH